VCDWIYLVQDRNQWQVHVGTAWNDKNLQEVEKCLASGIAVRFSRKTLPLGVT
jgi:hypothetical protein